MKPLEIISLLQKAEFRLFTRLEEYAFSGTQTDRPMISETEGYLLILDGEDLRIINPDSGQEFAIALIATKLDPMDCPIGATAFVCSGCNEHFSKDVLAVNPSDPSERYCPQCLEEIIGD